MEEIVQIALHSNVFVVREQKHLVFFLFECKNIQGLRVVVFNSKNCFVVSKNSSVQDNRLFAVETLNENNGLTVGIVKVQFDFKLVCFVAACKNYQGRDDW